MDRRNGSRQASQGWEQVWQGDGEGQASIVAGGLESRGIDTQVRGNQPLPQAYPTAWARSNWVIYVPSAEAFEARELLRDTGEESNVIDGRGSPTHEQLFTLKLAIAGLLGVAIISAVGALLFDWGA